jgi:hypothetical protein
VITMTARESSRFRFSLCTVGGQINSCMFEKHVVVCWGNDHRAVLDRKRLKSAVDKLSARVLNVGQNSQRQSMGVDVECLRPEFET